ncbi:MAG TPA: alpha/beta fold hydrolase [Ktedonobacterales bacterium]|nr:alpha/beta fold hydrolase [Ktedonobacterales bacterium]
MAPQPSRPLLAHEDTGSGAPVLLIHGFAGTARTHFAPLIAALEPEYRVIAPDLSGHGASATIERQVDARLHHHDAADLLALLEHLGLCETRQINLIGYSDGAETAIILAALLGERARGMTIWGVSGRTPPQPIVTLYADPEARIRSWPSLRAELERLHGPGIALPMLTRWAAAMEALREDGGAINDDEAARVMCPTLVLAGDHDPFNPLAATQALVARLPHARLMTLPGAGHDLLAEREAQVIALARRMLVSPQV